MAVGEHEKSNLMAAERHHNSARRQRYGGADNNVI